MEMSYLIIDSFVWMMVIIQKGNLAGQANLNLRDYLCAVLCLSH